MGSGSTALRITALDLGSTTGLATGLAGETPRARSLALSGTKTEKGAELFGLLSEHLLSVRPDVLYIEAAPNLGGMMQRGTNMDALQNLYGFEMVAAVAAHTSGVRVELVDVQKARAHFLRCRPPKGKGKQMVMQRCRVLRWAVDNNNEADALCVWDYASAVEAPNRWMKAVQEHAAH